MKTSIFRLDEIRSEEAESPKYLEAITSIRGHFSSLEIAVEAMKRNASETYLPEEIYAYLIKEIAVESLMGCRQLQKTIFLCLMPLTIVTAFFPFQIIQMIIFMFHQRMCFD